jgi:two-component system phosphate regulon sensor histidine kinase PhoR
VEIVHRQAERLSRLTQDLLDLSRLESRQVRFDLGPVDVGALARQVVELHASVAGKKGLALAAEVPEGLLAVADARALEQVLVNLVDNAIKYTGAGGVTIGASAHGQDVAITVSDTGPGIEPHHLARIFERFYRIDPGRSREAGGTGLGLAIAKHLVQGMAGEITVQSGAGGTTFRVRLPRASGGAATRVPDLATSGA